MSACLTRLGSLLSAQLPVRILLRNVTRLAVQSGCYIRRSRFVRGGWSVACLALQRQDGLIDGHRCPWWKPLLSPLRHCLLARQLTCWSFHARWWALVFRAMLAEPNTALVAVPTPRAYVGYGLASDRDCKAGLQAHTRTRHCLQPLTFRLRLETSGSGYRVACLPPSLSQSLGYPSQSLFMPCRRATLKCWPPIGSFIPAVTVITM